MHPLQVYSDDDKREGREREDHPGGKDRFCSKKCHDDPAYPMTPPSATNSRRIGSSCADLGR